MRTREPGGSEGAEAIRALLTDGGLERWDAVAETFLLSAARVDHCRRVIEPALRGGSWVVSDRFVDSMFAYQGAGRAVPPALLRTMVSYSVGDVMPDLTVICDVAVETADARVQVRNRDGGGGPTRYEQADPSLRRRIRQGFLDHASLALERCVVVDTAAPQEAVAARVWSVICERLSVDDGQG